MKASELRIGNLTIIDSENENKRIHSVVWNDLGFENTFLDPIQLTEEWLFKFGFEIEKANYRVYDIEARGKFFSVNKRINKDSFEISFYTYYEDVVFENFLYVHQLQNLYFALTGQELEVIN